MPSGRGSGTEAARQAIIGALADLGEPAVRELDRQVVQRSGGALLPAKHAAAEVFVRVGKPAVPAMTRRVLAWQVFPSREELLLCQVARMTAAATPRAMAAGP
jgi:hypothetical protein